MTGRDKPGHDETESIRAKSALAARSESGRWRQRHVRCATSPSEHLQRTRPVAKRSEIELAVRRLAPRIPPHELESVVDHALASRGLKSASAEAAAWLSLVAYVRHVFTEYDELLAQGYDQDSARFFVAADIQATLDGWGVQRRLDPI
jgi:hypothetical protein